MVFKRATYCTVKGKNRRQEPKISVKKLTVKNQKSQFVSSTQINLLVHHNKRRRPALSASCSGSSPPASAWGTKLNHRLPSVATGTRALRRTRQTTLRGIKHLGLLFGFELWNAKLGFFQSRPTPFCRFDLC